MFKLEIKTGGAAFRSDYETDESGEYILDPRATEVRHILMDICDKLAFGYTDGKIMDYNGNAVGKWSYE